MKRVLLGMPAYGGPTMAAAAAFFGASREHAVRHAGREDSSLLAHGFNRLWCEALNAKPDYFAMQHADVEPQPGWLDVLAGELEATGLDVLGVPIALKDGRGLTSTAVDGGDPWRPKFRLSTTEIHRLPETFTAADVGGPLLLNTGLWACRWGDWCERVFFTVRDTIAQTDSGEFVALVEPEDWNFSRRLNALGLKIGCTRKVKAVHKGPAKFSNAYPWGAFEFDRDNLERSAIP